MPVLLLKPTVLLVTLQVLAFGPTKTPWSAFPKDAGATPGMRSCSKPIELPVTVVLAALSRMPFPRFAPITELLISLPAAVASSTMPVALFGARVPSRVTPI